MSRIIGENIKNQLIIEDKIGGGVITLYYESASAPERIAYKSSLWQREGDKLKSRLTEARQEWGLKKMLGFKEGDFKFKIGDEPKIISSDPNSANYDPSWKDLISKYAPDVLEALAEHIFEAAPAFASQEGYTEKN